MKEKNKTQGSPPPLSSFESLMKAGFSELERKNIEETALIMGAGIAGLATAVALQNQGWKVRVFDAENDPKEHPGGLILTSNAVSVLQKLSRNWVLQGRGVELEQGLVQNWQGYILSEVPYGKLGREADAMPLVIDRQALHQFLSKELGPKRLYTNWTCLGYEQNRGEVTAVFNNDRKYHAGLLIGADGLYSTIRKQLHGFEAPQFAGYTCWQGITGPMSSDRFRPGTMFESHGRGARFCAAYIDETRIAWRATSNVTEEFRESDEGVKSLLFFLFQGWHPPIEDIIDATPSDSIVRTDIYARAPTEHWGEGRVTLVGDAAHPMTPDLHQGACAALEDAWVLSKSLTSHHTVSGALRAYEHIRQPRTADLQRKSWRTGKVGQWEQPLAVTLRDLVVQMTPASRKELFVRKLWGWRAR